METRIEVFLQKGINDSVGEGIKNDIQDLGIKKIKKVKTAQIYLVEGKISQSQKKAICQDLLIDPLIQKYYINSKFKINRLHPHLSPPPWRGRIEEGGRCWVVEVWFKKGVTDTVAESAAKGIRDMGIKGVKNIRTGKRYFVFGFLSSEEIKTISQRLLANKVIENYSIQKNG